MTTSSRRIFLKFQTIGKYYFSTNDFEASINKFKFNFNFIPISVAAAYKRFVQGLMLHARYPGNNATNRMILNSNDNSIQSGTKSSSRSHLGEFPFQIMPSFGHLIYTTLQKF